MKDAGDYISSKDYHRLIDACKEDEEVMLIILLWKTGRRVSEILGLPGTECEGLMPKDIDWENKEIHFWIIKKKERYKTPKPVDDKLLDILRFYINEKGIPFDERIIPKSRQWFDRHLKQLGEATGIRTFSGGRLHAHCFRHSWNRIAAKTAETPMDIALQKAYMEHSSENITMGYYMKFGTKEQRKLIERMKE